MAVEKFDASYYLGKNPDVVAAIARGIFKNAEDHFRQFGAAEGRRPNVDFDPAYYAVSNLDVLEAVNKKVFATVFDHYLKHGVTEIKLGEKTEGAEKAGKAFRAPNEATARLIENFDGDAYLKAHPDVKGYDAKTAVRHYLDKGKDLGYKPTTKDGATATTPGNTIYTTGAPVILLSGVAPVNAVVLPETGKQGLTSDADTIYVAQDTDLNGARIEDQYTGDGDRLIVTLGNSVTPASVKNVEAFDISVKGESGGLDFEGIGGVKTVNLNGTGKTKLSNVESGIEYTLKAGVNGLTILSGSRNTDKDAATLTLKGDADLALNLGTNDTDDIDQLTINNSGTNRVVLNTAFTKGESITIKGTSGLTLSSAWANVKDASLKAEGTTYALEISDALTPSASASPYNLTKLSALDKLVLSGTGTGSTAGSPVVPSITVNGIAASVKSVELTADNAASDFIGGGTGAVSNSLTLTGLQYDADGTTALKDANGKQLDSWSGTDDRLTLFLNKGKDIGGKLVAKSIETLTIDTGSAADHKIGGGLELATNATLKLVGSRGLDLGGAVSLGVSRVDASDFTGALKISLGANTAAPTWANPNPSNWVITGKGADEITLSTTAVGRDVIEFRSLDATTTSSAAGKHDKIVGFKFAEDLIAFSGDYGASAFSARGNGVQTGVTGATTAKADFSNNKVAVLTATVTDLASVGTAIGDLAAAGKSGLVFAKTATGSNLYYVSDVRGTESGSAADGKIQAEEIKLIGTFDGVDVLTSIPTNLNFIFA